MNQDDKRNEYRDRFQDKALEEAAGGKRPPDLAGKIERAAREKTDRRFSSRYVLAATVLVAVMGGGTAWFYFAPNHRDAEKEVLLSNTEASDKPMGLLRQLADRSESTAEGEAEWLERGYFDYFEERGRPERPMPGPEGVPQFVEELHRLGADATGETPDESLGEPEYKDTGITAAIPPGERAMRVVIDEPAAAEGTSFKPGDRVDLLFTLGKDGERGIEVGGATTSTISQNAEVLSVGGRTADGRRTVTLKVTPEQAAQLQLAGTIDKGALHAVARSPNDSEPDAARPAATRLSLEDSQVHDLAYELKAYRPEAAEYFHKLLEGETPPVELETSLSEVEKQIAYRFEERLGMLDGDELKAFKQKVRDRISSTTNRSKIEELEQTRLALEKLAKDLPGNATTPLKMSITKGLKLQLEDYGGSQEAGTSINLILAGKKPPEDLKKHLSDDEKELVSRLEARLADIRKKTTKTWKRSEVVPNASRLMIGDREELPLKGMQVQVRVDGFRARVVLDFHFLNDRAQQFEGTFKLRLPNGASPYFFAFGEQRYKSPDAPAQRPVFFRIDEEQDLRTAPEQIMEARRENWNEPKEARMVPKDKASHAYHSTVRRRVDPALLEWSGAGIFSARVFPIAPGKMHRIVLGYEVDLLPAGDDLEYRLDLPDVPECMVDLSVSTPEGMAATMTPEAEATPVAGRTYFHFENPEERSLVLRLASPGTLLLTGMQPETGEFFATRFVPDLPADANVTGSSHAVFLVDVSLSSNPDRFNIWLKLLQAVLKENRDTLKQFNVLFFNVERFWWKQQFVANTAENAEKLHQDCQRLALEGATDLGGAVAEAASPAWLDGKVPAWDLFLLSDGALTWGESDLHSLAQQLQEGKNGPLFAYSTGLAGTDRRTLEHLTRETGGAVFSVVGEEQIARAATAHRQRPWQLDSVELAGATDLLLAGRPRTLFPGQSLLLVGRGRPAGDAKVILKLRRGKQEKQVATRFDRVVASDLTPRIYGQVAVAQLEELKSSTEELSQAYACHFRVTGQTCSLLMLETEEDYQRYNIKPEEHAFVIKSTPAAGKIAKVLDEKASLLGDPKAEFLAWLKQMKEMPGVKFEVSTAFRLAVESLPQDAFAVIPPPLECRQRTWTGIPGDLQEMLAAKNLTYDAVVAEAGRRAKGSPADGLKALSSLVENSPGDTVLLRDVGFSALEWGLEGQAYHLFRRVAQRRPYEPQTYWAMAQCLQELGRPDLALAYYEVALAGQWDGRFGEFTAILTVDYLRFLRQAASGKVEMRLSDFAAARLKTLSQRVGMKQADLLITVTWNTDDSDVDLHIYEPGGEHCYYEHRQTKLGGRLTTDVTQGYGPEMYVLRDAKAGPFRVKAHYYSQARNRASARTKVFATIYRNWGRPNETVSRKVITLSDNKEMHDLATVVVEP